MTHPLFGGNKVRKLERLLGQAHALRATHIITVGAAGSNHCLATALHGRAAGFEVELALVPQADGAVARDNLRGMVATQARLHPCAGLASLGATVAARALRLRLEGARVYVIPFGGSSAEGAAGYAGAVDELEAQRKQLKLDNFSLHYVATGSGGTWAGLAAGLSRIASPDTLMGARVVAWPGLTRAGLERLASKTARRLGLSALTVTRGLDDTTLGDGYGRETEAAREALARFAEDGVVLDPTYSAKAAAGLVAALRARPPGSAGLLWATRSDVPGPRLEGALPEALARLLTA